MNVIVRHILVIRTTVSFLVTGTKQSKHGLSGESDKRKHSLIWSRNSTYYISYLILIKMQLIDVNSMSYQSAWLERKYELNLLNSYNKLLT